ncbi:transposase, partial [Anaerobacillus alkalilacustris]|uniref:transposase n=1 Tax=Anaerobacillus alkalilacustris TaxID=393763 RepID=UPI000A6032EB
GMVKANNNSFRHNDKRYLLKDLYKLATPASSKKNKDILRVIQTEMNHKTMGTVIPVKIVFIRHRHYKQEWLAILSTDLTLSAEDIIRIYRRRWQIETFFKAAKSLLKLESEFQGRSYDLLISHTTIVFTRYILIAWQQRCSNDQRTFGGLFYDLTDELQDIDWATALCELLLILEEVSKESNKAVQNLIKNQIVQWVSHLPNYIKALVPISWCET